MLIDFKDIQEFAIPNLVGGEGIVHAKMTVQPDCQIMLSRIEPGASIGMHAHLPSSDINYIISGTGKAICNGVEEILVPGSCHYCPQGAEHTIINTGDEDLVIFIVVPEKQEK